MTQVVAEELETEIEDNLAEEEELIPFKYSITSYGADYPIDGLVQRIKDGTIYIPSFQRGFVWSYNQASRFVESLLLGLPVPGIFLSKEGPTQKLLVIDGQQRLRTLQYFYEGIFAPNQREFTLRDVQREFRGATYKTLKDKDRRRLNDSILHATVVKQDEPSEDNSSVYYIFERLNTGGSQLLAQEIRACIYHGDFNELLRTLNENEHWRGVFGPVNKRMRDQELILRFLALYFNADNYEEPMKQFLNKFMARNRDLKRIPEELLTRAFASTIEIVHRQLGGQAFRPVRALNAAVLDAVMVALARRLAKGPIKRPDGVSRAYQALLKDSDFVKISERSTASLSSVASRLKIATHAFTGIS